jgi:hypothetical protein
MPPGCYNILKKNNVRIFVGSFKKRDFQFPGVLLGQVTNLVPDAENIPVEPDQGNACAGKVAPLFVYASLSQHFS